MSKKTVIIVGAGRAGGEIQLDAFTTIPQTEVVAICDPDSSRAEFVANKNKIAAFYPSLQDALHDHDPDIVSICSPPKYHLEQCRQALATGANVLLEKPMVMSVQEADYLYDLMQQSDGELCVVHNYKFQRGIKQSQAMINQGRIGRILHLERTWLRNGKLDRMISNQDSWSHSLPGGRWTETVAHDIYIAYQYLGEFDLEAVHTQKVSELWPWLLADEVAITLKGHGSYLSIRFSANEETPLIRNMYIHGSKGVIVSDATSAHMITDTSEIKRFISAGMMIGKKGLRRAIGVVKRKESSKNLAWGTGHLELIERFLSHLDNDTPTPVSWEEAYFTMSMLSEIGSAIQHAADHDSPYMAN